MNNLQAIPFLSAMVLMFGLGWVEAADINQPTHLPNRAMNKINQVRLQGLVAEDEIEKDVAQEFGNIGIDRLQQTGCNLNLGNTIVSSGNLSGDRDVIITGDVINFCDQ
ncbi:MAG: hypothetical protein G8D61_16920 [gamma proteobacterium symbiont of Ctena orbiculata]|nr:hypothetical protein [Candidatus Thiodiazotropha taylori]MBT3059133.1 hypothetical protein [Candidatus Thiodiazotropha sp. (ex Lucina pensylvanica)]MBV2093391.1 hypothetical protein [Candidatus Thiodiazotropha sp. (ex Codakia orbicularis)]PUB78602.1 MAG: hypothetical protein DBP03_00915 [gamma proteobacterium symbiont of Ctena orbiculata]MBT3064122.1 hypothetical protein [Candidatus Thiodiazotropha sp. (ex Lucina pensylvanica)]